MSLIYPAMCLLYNNYMSKTIVIERLSYSKKVIVFVKKRMKDIFVYFLEFILTLDKSFSTLMSKSSQSEAKVF